MSWNVLPSPTDEQLTSTVLWLFAFYLLKLYETLACIVAALFCPSINSRPSAMFCCCNIMKEFKLIFIFCQF